MRRDTLCFLVTDTHILLALKKRGFGAGKWNGPGGKAEEGETIEEAAVRELEEEVMVKTNPAHLERVAHLTFRSAYDPTLNIDADVFFARVWEGEPQESEEMRPAWYAHGEIPFSEMWPDDKYWLPRILAGEKLHGRFHFTADGKDVEEYEIKELS